MGEPTDAIVIDGRRIGPGSPVFVIAEAGVNWNGDLELAKQLVGVAADAGADAVKFQTFRAEEVASPDAPKARYQLDSTDRGESQRDMLRHLSLSPDDHRVLCDYCRSNGVVFLSTPFGERSADLLDALGVPAFKISSGDATHLLFLAHVAGKGKPVILSTGMCYLNEVDVAVRTLRAAGCPQLALLHCVSNYPADPADANLRAIATMADCFNVPIGYSDHTTGSEAALAAVALGACIIEKHLTLDKNLPGPDHRASNEPSELRALIAGIRTVERALGTGRKVPAQSELENRRIVRRSVAVSSDIPADTVLTREMLTAVRPGTGIPPELTEYIVGRKLTRRRGAGELLAWSDLA
jgi:N,N'-diacetyllegionaminate synthase